jgi:hypothetical protein
MQIGQMAEFIRLRFNPMPAQRRRPRGPARLCDTTPAQHVKKSKKANRSKRTTDLTETLEQQTATAKVLEVISRSAFELKAVFEAVVESSVPLCGAERGVIYRFDGETLRMASSCNAPPQLVEWIEQNPHPTGCGSHIATRHSSCRAGTPDRPYSRCSCRPYL